MRGLLFVRKHRGRVWHIVWRTTSFCPEPLTPGLPKEAAPLLPVGARLCDACADRVAVLSGVIIAAVDQSEDPFELAAVDGLDEHDGDDPR